MLVARKSVVLVKFSSEDFVNFLLRNQWVGLRQSILLLFNVIEGALMILRHAVLGAEDVTTLAGGLNYADLLLAEPTFIRVSLKLFWLIRIGRNC